MSDELVKEARRHAAEHFGKEGADFGLVNTLADRIEDLEAENARLREAVFGWRERDWPEGFDRRTAELIAESAREALNRRPRPLSESSEARPRRQ